MDRYFLRHFRRLLQLLIGFVSPVRSILGIVQFFTESLNRGLVLLDGLIERLFFPFHRFKQRFLLSFSLSH